jgi:hypothetical protein
MFLNDFLTGSGSGSETGAGTGTVAKVFPSPWDVAQNGAHLHEFLQDMAGHSAGILVDPFGFEFILETTTVLPQASVVLMVQRPGIFLAAARAARPAFCTEPFLFSSARMNGKRGRFEDKWMTAFGTACPSDFQLLKQYHQRNILARLLVHNSVTVADVGTGEGLFEACKLMSTTGTVAPRKCSGVAAVSVQSNSYAGQLRAVSSVAEAHALYWRLISADLTMLASESSVPHHDSLASAMAGAVRQCSNDVPIIVGAGLSKTGTTSVAKTLSGWNISSGHWLECKNLYRVIEWEDAWHTVATGRGTKVRSGLRMFNSITKDLEAMSDLPVPHLLTELLLLRPAAVTVYTERDAASWTRSFQAWLAKSCKSKEFKGCPSNGSGTPTSIVEETPIRRVLEAAVCPSGVLAFGVTCPSVAQASKRYILHGLTVRFVVPAASLMRIEATRLGATTEPLCDGLKQRLAEPKVGDRLQRSCRLTHGSDTVKYHGRSGADIFASMECAEGVMYRKANVNKALHGGKV